ncbi:MAG: helix-turn-helix domain-containing protein [archaeon GB-1867-035]|nr:helix-turn-helix domain-containing protein [Candidatus Culexmicrobium profundum]
METSEFVEAIIQSLKNPTRASIFYQLVKKHEATATEIARDLGIDVDVVYYHLKLLRRMKLVSKPRIVVKGNYVEKYYSIRSDFKEKLLESMKLLITREKELGVEEFREMVIALFSVVQSILSGSIRRLREADEGTLSKIRDEDSVESKIIFCNRERYVELLGKLREITRGGVLDTFDPAKKDYVILVIAIPKIDGQ